MQFKSTDLDWYVKKFIGIISYVICNKFAREMTGIKRGAQHVMKAAEFIGHEIKENTELAEHKTGIQCSKSLVNKMKNLISWSNQSN